MPSSVESAVAWAALVVSIVGVGVLIWYTIETYRLRKEVQRQTAMMAKPALFVGTRRRPSSSNLTLNVENIGEGPAFNVRFEPITGTDCKLSFRPIPLLLVGEKYRELEFDVGDGSEFEEPVPETIASFMSGRRLPSELTLKALFQDHSGKRYETSFAMKRCNEYAQMVGDLSITFQGQREINS